LAGGGRSAFARMTNEVIFTLGSPAYIAPEVAAGREVSPAADLWGLGATLFATVEGRAPYDPDGPVLTTLSTVIHGDVPAASGPLAEVIGALMVKDPAERVPLAEVRRMLHPLLPEPGTPLFPATDEEAPTRTELPVVETPARVVNLMDALRKSLKTVSAQKKKPASRRPKITNRRDADFQNCRFQI